MKISSSFNNIDKKNNSYQSFKGVPPNPKYIPEFVGNLGKLAGEYIRTPEQKLFLALSALMFQPIIDLKHARDDKKVDSAIKSASKAIAGGFTGVLIRAAFLKLTDYYIGFQKRNKLNKLFFPKSAIQLNEVSSEIAKIRMKQYNQTLGSLFAVLFMIFFSNSKVDVPLTAIFQDIISGIVKEDKSWLLSLNDVLKDRKNKITNWLKDKYSRLKNIYVKTKKIINIIREENTKPKDKEPKK